MSSILNPFAFTPLGQPAALTVSALRCIGGPATAEQLSAAQAAFQSFCSQARLSAAPNPTSIGQLPDGSQYKIAVVGAQTTMTLWPIAGEKGRPMKPGIGVTSAGGRWILRPPGKRLKPGSEKWAVEEVKSIKGGEVYVFSEDEYFVEAPAGLSQNNERVADCIHGAPGSRYVWAANTFDVSSPFLASGAVKQLKIDGGALKLGERRVVDGVPDATLATSTHALPEVFVGDRWSMVSSNTTGESIVVCRTEVDPDAPPEGEIGSRVCAVAHMKAGPPPKGAARPPNTLVEVTSVQSLAPVVVERAPKAAAGEAPGMSEWSETKEEEDSVSSVTLTNPNPYSDHPTFEVDRYSMLRKYGYGEKARFESRSTYRAYIGSDGQLITDTLTRRDHALLSAESDGSSGGYDFEIWVDWTRKNNSSKKVAVDRFDELSLGGELGVKPYALKIDFESQHDGDNYAKSYYLFPKYNELGNIIGFIFGGTARFSALTTAKCKIERARETVLFFDDQFKVAVIAKVKLTVDYTLRSGVPPQTATDGGSLSHTQRMFYESVFAAAMNRGDASFPRVHETATTVKYDVTLEVLHGTNRSSTKLGAPDWLKERGGDAIRMLLDELIAAGANRAMRPEGDPEATEGVRPNRFFREYGLTEVVDGVFSEQLGDVMYAKDPKTGAGFFSFVWADKPYNYVVGPWGVAPSSSKTPIAKDAAVGALQSV